MPPPPPGRLVTGIAVAFDFEIVEAANTSKVLRSGNDEKVFFGDLTPDTWEPSKRYLYTIAFDPIQYLTYVVPSIDPWVDYSGDGTVDTGDL